MMFRSGNLDSVPIVRTSTIDDIYWNSNTSGQGYNVSLNLGDDGRIYLLNSTGFSIKNITGGGCPRNSSVVYLVTLDVDGIFRFYSHDLRSNSSSIPMVLWASFHDGLNGLCGINGYCTLMDTKAVCSCPPGFIFVDLDNPLRGCDGNFTRQSCTRNEENIGYSMSSMENTAWLDEPYAFYFSMTKDDCKEACLQDCNCEAALYSNGKCTKQKLPLSFGRANVAAVTTTTAFIKVGNGGSANTDGPSMSRGTVANTSRNIIRLNTLIACIAFASSSFIGFVIFYFLVCRHRRWRYEPINN